MNNSKKLNNYEKFRESMLARQNVTNKVSVFPSLEAISDFYKVTSDLSDFDSQWVENVQTQLVNDLSPRINKYRKIVEEKLVEIEAVLLRIRKGKLYNFKPTTFL